MPLNASGLLSKGFLENRHPGSARRVSTPTSLPLATASCRAVRPLLFIQLQSTRGSSSSKRMMAGSVNIAAAAWSGVWPLLLGKFMSMSCLARRASRKGIACSLMASCRIVVSVSRVLSCSFRRLVAMS